MQFNKFMMPCTTINLVVILTIFCVSFHHSEVYLDIHIDPIKIYIYSLVYSLKSFTVANCHRATIAIEDGSVKQLGSSIGSIVGYTCNEGSTLIGTRWRQCLSGRWSGKKPLCRRK